jgi:thiosulfate/3-mercaptopyruvate sulfurtransferase
MATTSRTPALVSARSIIDSIKAGDEPSKKFKFIDGSWYLNKERNPKEEFMSSRIRSAQQFDIDSISDAASGLPHMLPSAEAFAAAVSSLGISNDDHVLVYVKKGSFSAPRVWWTFQVFNHSKVSVIDGGYEEWVRDDGPIEEGPVSMPTTGSFTATLNRELLVQCFI